ncbi:hypothetical protein MVEN_01515000 [Mycena venus]|uniref:AMP-binding enzyme C-terminal domain-containing protein n=1 Tax=Mycena venus TaxID=2733690 RepID=A0A8H6XT26_9AGAR|nr:hypothetical protein MVEN_01515000 [Mycena venus]
MLRMQQSSEFPTKFLGKSLFAFVVLKAPVGSQVKNDRQFQKKVQDSISKHVSSSKSSYKWLTGGIEFVEAIPKNASGKILRRVLREQATALPRAKL